MCVGVKDMDKTEGWGRREWGRVGGGGGVQRRVEVWRMQTADLALRLSDTDSSCLFLA